MGSPALAAKAALSFAGEERVYVDEMAELLRAAGANVFYDRFEEAVSGEATLRKHSIKCFFMARALW